MRRGTDINEVVTLPEPGGSSAYIDDRLQVADLLELILDGHSGKKKAETALPVNCRGGG